MRREGQHIEHRRELSARGRRFVELATLLAGLLVAAPEVAQAKDRHDPDNAMAQLRGENVEERRREIESLERDCATLEARIAKLERSLEAGGMRYVQDPGLEGRERWELNESRRELARKRAAIERLEAGMREGAAGALERRERALEFSERSGLAFTDPTLDLSPEHIGNARISSYFEKYKIGWKDHALYFDVQDGTPDGARLALPLGPEFTDADFYFQDNGNDLLIVFTMVDGRHNALQLDDGYYAGFYASDAQGRPVIE